MSASGTVAAPIVLTSLQDDSIGGDTNDDGTASFGAAGQWEALYIDSSGSVLSHVEIRYAGNVNAPGGFRAGV